MAEILLTHGKESMRKVGVMGVMKAAYSIWMNDRLSFKF